MKRFLRSTLAIVSLLAVPSLAKEPTKPVLSEAGEVITVRAGNSKTLKAEHLSRLALGDPEIADVKTAGDDVVRIDGLKAGETQLIVWAGKARKQYRIVVTK